MHTPPRLRFSLVSLLVLQFAPACTTLHGIGKLVDVDLDSDPAGAEVCVLDETLWYSAGKQRFEQALAKGAWDPWFDKYRKTEGLTPLTLRIPQSIQHFVLHRDALFVHREYAPAANPPKRGEEHGKVFVRLGKKEATQ